jgi:hypothetical protein
VLNQTLLADLPATIQLTGFICQICHDLDRRGDRPGHVPLHEASERADADQPEQLTRQPSEFDNPSVRTGAADARKAAQLCGRRPDDALLFMYLNYVNNTFRTHQIGAVRVHVWRDTLASCVAMMGRQRRDELEGFLSRGYEPALKRAEVLARYDAIGATTLPQRDTRRLALVG